MRINLVTPFAEKEAVKALGARWDAAKKRWYIVDVTDLTPFSRWIPNLGVVTENSDTVAQQKASPAKLTQPQQTKTSTTAKSVSEGSHCGCNVLPWDDCAHTIKPCKLYQADID